MRGGLEEEEGHFIMCSYFLGSLVTNGCTLNLVVEGDASPTSDSDTEDSQQQRSSDGTPQIEHTSSNSLTTPPLDHTSSNSEATPPTLHSQATPPEVSISQASPPMDHTHQTEPR